MTELIPSTWMPVIQIRGFQSRGPWHLRSSMTNFWLFEPIDGPAWNTTNLPANVHYEEASPNQSTPPAISVLPLNS
jgi:hypothetical protein